MYSRCCLVFYGHDVVINDLNKLTLDRFPDELKKKKQQLQQSDLILDQPFSGTYHLEPDLEAAVEDVDFIIEAIQEDLGSKKLSFKSVHNTMQVKGVSNACRTDTVLLTSTINLRLEDVFSLTSDKERTLGLRFLHPVYFVQDVEVRYHEKTSADVMDKVTRFVEEDLPKSIFMRRAGEEPLLLSDTAITAMEEARREELRRQIRDPNIATVNFSLEAQRDSFPSLGPDDDEDDDDVGGRPDNLVFGHGGQPATQNALLDSPIKDHNLSEVLIL
ncbi:putative lambda-crystallin-like [Apostichopus japonicus]|uniref:Putative lambda-crystallin-like n=1 Tax=Stichopus japonicus TaxID=307972 RepID=A0A2G8LMT3_STIJA|nr:putative lambda-crystallin-like [Apostichopus japonicus]